MKNFQIGSIGKSNKIGNKKKKKNTQTNIYSSRVDNILSIQYKC